MRIRTIKPTFWTDSKVQKLSHFTRLFYIGLWNYADDKGRFQADFRLIKAALFPIDDAVSLEDIRLALGECYTNGMLRLYKHEDDYFGEIVKFLDHQKIDKPSKFCLPEFVEDSGRALLGLAVGNGSSKTEDGSSKTEISSLPKSQTAAIVGASKKSRKAPVYEKGWSPVALYCEKFEKRFHNPFKVKGKDAKLLTELGEISSESEFRTALNRYFETRLEYMLEASLPPHYLHRDFNKWLQLGANQEAIAAENIPKESSDDPFIKLIADQLAKQNGTQP